MAIRLPFTSVTDFNTPAPDAIGRPKLLIMPGGQTDSTALPYVRFSTFTLPLARAE